MNLSRSLQFPGGKHQTGTQRRFSKHVVVQPFQGCLSRGAFLPRVSPGATVVQPAGLGSGTIPRFSPGATIVQPAGLGSGTIPRVAPGATVVQPAGLGSDTIPGLHPGLLLFSPPGWGIGSDVIFRLTGPLWEKSPCPLNQKIPRKKSSPGNFFYWPISGR